MRRSLTAVPMTVLLALGMLGCSQTSSRSDDRRDGGDGESNAPDARASKNQNEADGPAAGGKAVFSETAHDFGDVEEGETVTHVFKVRNAGSETLHIGRVRGS